MVEDDAAQVELMRESMRHIKLLNECEVASSGEQALAQLREAATRPELILVDLNLPGMSGLELIEQLRASEQTRSIPVVALSSVPPTAQVQAGLQALGTPSVLKPLSTANDYLTLVRAVRTLGLAIVRR